MQYRPLNLDLFVYKKVGEQESFRLRVTTPLRTEQNIGAAQPVSFDPELRLRLRLLEARRLDEAGLVALDNMLGEMIFPARSTTITPR